MRLQAGALLLWIAGSAAAQDDSAAGQVHISVSGRADLTYAARDRRLNESALWIPGGLPPGSPIRATDTLVLPDVAVRFDIDSPIGAAAVEFGNLPLHFTDADPRFQQDRLGGASAVELTLLQAWVEFLEVLRFGLQDFVWDPTGHGNPLFLAPSRSESPWGELPDSTVPPFPGFGTNTVPQTRRDQQRPVGLTARWGDTTFFALLALEGGNRNSDQSLAGGFYDTSIGDFRVGALLCVLAGNSWPRDGDKIVGTAGLTVTYAADSLFASAEAYLQRGDAGSYPGTPGLRAEGNAVRVQAGFGDTVRLQLTATRVSGDRRGDDRKEGRFLSYEDNDATLIVEGNDFGLDVDSNYMTLQFSAAVPFQAGGMRIEPRVQVAAFRFLEAVPLPPDPPPGIGGRSRALGTEVDAGVDVAYTAQLAFTLAGAWLFNARALENFTVDRDDRAWLLTLGARLRF
ncbi:MAG TPA: hypothetical protein VE981_08585 [Planctomycetota bacterium]|nr:hypothetical protein [Planctomycetota bacterium]